MDWNEHASRNGTAPQRDWYRGNRWDDEITKPYGAERRSPWVTVAQWILWLVVILGSSLILTALGIGLYAWRVGQ